MSTKRARLDGSMEIPNATLTGGAVNVLNTEYTFILPPSFSVYRNKACSIKVVSASVVYDSASARYTHLATAIDLATNIPVQGLCHNFPNDNNSQVVQANLQILDVAETRGAFGLQVFSATSPDSCVFRCQALPDKITLFMLRTNEQGADPLIGKHAPNQASMTLQIDFDEPI